MASKPKEEAEVSKATDKKVIQQFFEEKIANVVKVVDKSYLTKTFRDQLCSDLQSYGRDRRVLYM